MSAHKYDIENQLSVAQAITGTSAVVSTHSYKKQTAAQDISIGRRMALLILPTVAAGAGTSLKFDFIQSAAATLTSPDVLNSVTVAAADCVPGDQIIVPCPQGVMSKQYLGMQCTMTGGTTTVTVDCYLVPEDEIAVYKSFPKVNDVVI